MATLLRLLTCACGARRPDERPMLKADTLRSTDDPEAGRGAGPADGAGAEPGAPVADGGGNTGKEAQGPAQAWKTAALAIVVFTCFVAAILVVSYQRDELAAVAHAATASSGEVAPEARCMRSESHAQWQWLTAPASPVAVVSRWVFITVCAGVGVFVLGRVVPVAGPHVLQCAVQTAAGAALGEASPVAAPALSVLDVWTDVLLGLQWWKCGHSSWAYLGGALVALGLAPALAVLYWAPVTVRRKAALDALPPLKPREEYATELEYENAKRRYEETDEYRAHERARGYLLGAKAFEAALESAPQTYLQLYALLALGLSGATPLAVGSLALSVAIIGQGALWLMKTDSWGQSMGLTGVGQQVLGVACVASDALCRALSIGLFGLAFHNLLALALCLAAAGLVILVRFSRDMRVHVLWNPARHREGPALEAGRWLAASAVSGLYYMGVGCVDLTLRGQRLGGQLAIHAYLAAVQAALALSALWLPSEWRTGLEPGVAVGLAAIWVAAWVVHLVTTGALVWLADEKRHHIDWSNLGLSDACAFQYLRSFLEESKHLELLDLSSNDMRDVGAVAIAKALEVNGALKLEILNLRNNKIGDVGATAIAKGLEFNGALNLRVLDLNNNKIGDVGATAIGKYLQSEGASKLEELYLYSNEIGDGGATAIGKGLQFNGALNVTTYLSSNPISQSTKSEFRQSDNRLRF